MFTINLHVTTMHFFVKLFSLVYIIICCLLSLFQCSCGVLADSDCRNSELVFSFHLGSPIIVLVTWFEKYCPRSYKALNTCNSIDLLKTAMEILVIV